MGLTRSLIHARCLLGASGLQDERRAAEQALSECQRLQAETKAVIREKQVEMQSLEMSATTRSSASRVEEQHLSVDEIRHKLTRCSSERSQWQRTQKVLEEKLAHVSIVDEESIVAKQATLARVIDHAATLEDAIRNLEDGIESTQERTVEANAVALAEVRKHFQRLFTSVVPRKSVDLRSLGDLVEVCGRVGYLVMQCRYLLVLKRARGVMIV